MLEGLTIRDATPRDTEAMARVIRESFSDVAARFSLTPENCPKHPSNCTSAWVESDLARGVRYFVLSHGEECVGCVGLEHPGPDLCYLERLAVVPQRRRRGLGRALALHALGCARESGARQVSVGIVADHTELKEWYTRLGFCEVETRMFKHLPFQVAFMELDLNQMASPAAAAPDSASLAQC